MDDKLLQAVALHQQGQCGEAEVLYREVLRAHPNHFDALHLLGVSLLQQGQAEAACDWISLAIAIDPKQAAAHSNLGLALQALQHPRQALACYAQAIHLNPSYAEAHYNHGNALLELNRPQEALSSYAEAVRLKPDYVEAIYNQGKVLQDLDRLEEALACYTRALQLKPDDADTLSNSVIVLNDYGLKLQRNNRLAEALDCFDRALRLKPDCAEAISNRGFALYALNRPKEAQVYFEQAWQLKPDLAAAHWNEGLAWLLMGDYQTGFAKYEWRWQAKTFSTQQRHNQHPLWLGDVPLQGKTILLHAEQGYGDTLQFCRYAKLVAATGATVFLEVQVPLKPLLANLEGVSQLFGYGEPLPIFDYQCPLVSLPLAFNTRLNNIPASPAYLHADPTRINAWQTKLGEKKRPRIGLAWSGSTTHTNNHNRSIPLSDMCKLLSQQAQFISLQKELSTDEREILQQNRIAEHSEDLLDFSETAALISQLDWVIAVDTAVAHLAAALGKPVWLLLPFNPDWRWLLDRDDSPWYPTIRLFRQAKIGDWDSVIAKVAEELQKEITPLEGVLSLNLTTKATRDNIPPRDVIP